MQKQPHRAIEKTADNRYWQNQFCVDDAELAPTAEYEAYEPPTFPVSDVRVHAGTERKPRPPRTG